MKYLAEYTDTFGGEANYCCVRRAEFDAPANASNAVLVRRAKRAVGITGRHRTSGAGDMLAIHPTGTCTILFVQPAHTYA